MSNNCCGTDFVDGGTWSGVQLIDSKLVNPELVKAVMTGGVTMDEATVTDVVDQLCAALKSCVKSHVDNGEFTDVTIQKANLISATLTNAVFNGTVTISDSARASFANELCEHLKECVLGHVKDNVHDRIEATSGVFTMSEFKGLVTASTEAAKAFADIVGPHIKASVVEHIENARLKSLTASEVALTNTSLMGTLQLSQDASNAIYTAIEHFVSKTAGDLVTDALKALTPADIGAVDAKNPVINKGQIIDTDILSSNLSGGKLVNMSGTNVIFDTGRLSNFTLAGQVPLDSEARDHLCAQLRECIISIMDAAFSQQDVAAVFADCEGVPRAPGTRIVSCADMKSAIDLAEQRIINQMPISDVISGLTYDEATHKIILETTLNGGVPQKWEIALDELGGQVVTDQETIIGDGTTKNPLRVNLTEYSTPVTETQGTALPTNIIGGRAQLLGAPDAWIDMGGFLFPVYRKPGE